MSLSRGEFLKSLGKSLPGMALGAGATAAQTLLAKVAAVSGEREIVPAPTAPTTVSTPKAEFIERGPAEGNFIALTFDDGPRLGVTDLILDELQRRGLKATFFMIGQNVVQSPELARRVLAEGHTVANHSFTHPKLSVIPDAAVTEELQKTQDVMVDLLGHRPIWMRPPYCAFREDQIPLATALGLSVVNFSINPNDWAKPAEDIIIARVLQDAHAGGIVLCHDLHVQTANALPAILDGLAERGLEPVNLDRLLAR